MSTRFDLKKKVGLGLAAIIALTCVWIYKGHLARMAGWPFLPETPSPENGALRFAVIGDYGAGAFPERDVARMIKSWQPDFITTLGDNNYPGGASDTIDKNIGQYFHEYIGDYKGRHGPGASENAFFPIPGHRDWDSEALQPYLDYFTLPGNERYYEFIRGPVHFFMLDTDQREPDGTTPESVQGQWLKERLAASSSPWKLVYAHHAPYTSHTVEDCEWMRWPFGRWGASAVLSGFYHVYERLDIEGIPYFINGAGGQWISNFGEVDPHSQFRYNEEFGAMIVDATPEWILYRFVNRKGDIIDTVKAVNTKVGK